MKIIKYGILRDLILILRQTAVVNNFGLDNILTRIELLKEFETTITISKNVLKKELENDIDTWKNFYFSMLIPIPSKRNNKKYVGSIKSEKFSF